MRVRSYAIQPLNRRQPFRAVNLVTKPVVFLFKPLYFAPQPLDSVGILYISGVIISIQSPVLERLVDLREGRDVDLAERLRPIAVLGQHRADFLDFPARKAA